MGTHPREHFTEHQETSYEFINSLASVRSLSELLVDHPKLAAGDRIRFLTRLNHEAERMVRLLKKINGNVAANQSTDVAGPV